MMLSQKNYNLVTALLLTLGALAHLVRIISGGPVVMNGLVAPMWGSWVGLVIAGYLAWNGWNMYRKA